MGSEGRAVLLPSVQGRTPCCSLWSYLPRLLSHASTIGGSALLQGKTTSFRKLAKTPLQTRTSMPQAYNLTQVEGVMAVYSYTRVSTDRQAEEGESLGAQQRRVEGYAMMNGMTVDRHFVERGVSGSVPVSERQEGAALLAALKPGDTVITPKLDRMFRSARDALNVLHQLREMGVSLHMIDLGGDVTGNGIAKMVFTILSAVAEAERDRIRERISDVKKDQKARKRYLGGKVPFGYRVGEQGDLVEHEAEQKAVALIRELKGEGKSLRGIAEAVQETGISISHVGVKEVLTRDMV